MGGEGSPELYKDVPEENLEIKFFDLFEVPYSPIPDKVDLFVPLGPLERVNLHSQE